MGLRFLSECPTLHHTLRELDLLGCRNAALHLSELSHILQLQALKYLIIRNSFTFSMDPRVLLLPLLPKLEYQPHADKHPLLRMLLKGPFVCAHVRDLISYACALFAEPRLSHRLFLLARPCRRALSGGRSIQHSEH